MRKWFIGMLLGAILLLAIVPSFAQDEPGTIADIITAWTTAETPEFTRLLSTLQASDPAILELLSDPEAHLTLFAPTDAAFEVFAAQIGNQPDEVIADILRFHILERTLSSIEITVALEENDGALRLSTLQEQSIDLALTEDEGVFVNGANLDLTMIDIQASNGVIHVIDTVIIPEMRTIADLVIETADMAEGAEFTALLEAIQAAAPSVLATLADPTVELTVFAPTDAAFAALGGETLTAILADQELLTTILLYHVVPGLASSGDISAILLPAAGMIAQMETVQSQNITITATDDGVFINDARIIMTDIDAANGVIHIIDMVILPAIE